MLDIKSLSIGFSSYSFGLKKRTVQAMIWKVVLNIAEKRNLGLLVISHDGALISSLCRRTLDYFIQPG